MAPHKFNLFKSRSKDQPEKPSTENLLQSMQNLTTVDSPDSPIASTNRIIVKETRDAESVSLDQLLIERHPSPARRMSACNRQESGQMAYQTLHNQNSSRLTSSSTLQEDLDEIQLYEEFVKSNPELDGSTSYDVTSLQYDEASLASSEEMPVSCSGKRKKKTKEEEQMMKDRDMWTASNIEVIENLLNKNTLSLDDQIKWQAIANARGLCTLSDCCTCGDCIHAKYLAGVTDGDAGMGVAPLLNVSVGCNVQ